MTLQVFERSTFSSFSLRRKMKTLQIQLALPSLAAPEALMIELSFARFPALSFKDLRTYYVFPKLAHAPKRSTFNILHVPPQIMFTRKPDLKRVARRQLATIHYGVLK